MFSWQVCDTFRPTYTTGLSLFGVRDYSYQIVLLDHVLPTEEADKIISRLVLPVLHSKFAILYVVCVYCLTIFLLFF